ncbi:hypothetical protein EDB81DRAFT_932574 [Dactylonectria macrodidyma]|uniref:Ketoreductase domain-containing protein n=1 Tax=Dactylonectria macrodidyma TaxID=307937 RepID=A0A9P9EXV4_9HYPO|nr:hypothetical protein EDB81DRAFT_932574 [Dactylonectria macrodidyma]
MSKSFSGKVIAITGAGRGIARGAAVYLAERGATLSLSDVVEQGLNDLKNEIADKFPDVKVLIQIVDVSDAASVDNWIKKTVSEFGGLDGAANFAGVLHNTTAQFTDIKDEDWHRVININLTGTMYSMRSELSVMNDGGSIVNASSVAALRGGPGVVAYAASKAGVISLTTSAAKEVGIREIRVNALCPSGIDTPMFRQLSESGYTEEMILAPNAIKRFGKVEESAALIAFLLGDESKFITGETIRIDGGMCA